MSLLKKLGTALKGKKKQANFINKMPVFESELELSKFISRKQEAENAQMKADNLRLQSEVENLKKKTKDQVTQEQIEQEVLKEKAKKKTESASKSLKLAFVDVEDNPTFFLKSNRPFHKLAGIYLHETDNGQLVYYPWVKVKQGHKLIDKRLTCPAFSFNQFFREQVGIVSQIKGGKVDSNFDITAKGEFILKLPDEYVDVETKEKVKLINITDVKKKEYEDKIEGLNDKISELFHRLKQANLKEADYMAKLAEEELRTDVAEKERSVWAANSQFLAEKQKATTEQLSTAVAAEQDLKMQQILEARMVKVLSNGLDKMRERLGERLSMREYEVEENKIRRIMRDTVSEAIRLTSGNRPARVETQSAPQQQA